MIRYQPAGTPVKPTVPPQVRTGLEGGVGDMLAVDDDVEVGVGHSFWPPAGCTPDPKVRGKQLGLELAVSVAVELAVDDAVELAVDDAVELAVDDAVELAVDDAVEVEVPPAGCTARTTFEVLISKALSTSMTPPIKETARYLLMFPLPYEVHQWSDRPLDGSSFGPLASPQPAYGSSEEGRDLKNVKL
jgi:hypothetical protein